MKLEHKLKKPNRFKTNYIGYCINIPNKCNHFYTWTHINSLTSYWYDDIVKRWDKYWVLEILKGNKDMSMSNICDCKSIKAFKRHIRKHSKYLPIGTEFILSHRYVGVDVSFKLTKKYKRHIMKK